MRRHAILALLGVLGACRRPGPADDAVLMLLRDGREVARLGPAELLAAARPEVVRAFDPYYGRRKAFQALPLRPILERGFAAPAIWLREQEFVLRARDGYTVPIAGARLLEEGAYLAVADLEVAGWEPIGPQRTSPGPLYLVWGREGQQDLLTHPRPWQLQEIEIARFEALFPRTVPVGEPESAPAWRGFRIFRRECIRCHAVNRQGGRLGPDLNLPLSIVEYRPPVQIRAFIRNPARFRYGAMPPHPHLTEEDLDGLLAYFEAMRQRKQDDGAPLVR